MFTRLRAAWRRWLEQRNRITALKVDLAAVPWDRGETPEYLAANDAVHQALTALPWWKRGAWLYPADVESVALNRVAGTLTDLRAYLFERLVTGTPAPGESYHSEIEMVLWVAEGHRVADASWSDGETPFARWADTLYEAVENARQRRHDDMLSDQHGV